MKNLEKNKIKDLKVAIVADELQYWGGAQDNILAFSKVFPNSTIYTSIYEDEVLEKHFQGKEVKASFIQKMPFEKKLRQEYFLLYPLAFKMLNLKNYDLVISVSSAFAKFVKSPKGVKHFLYCLTPPRYLWLENRSQNSGEKFSFKIYSMLKPFLHSIWRRKDKVAAQSADMVATNSKEVASRVKEFYELDAKVLYPPVEMEYLKFNPNYETRKDWFLYIGRVEKYKGVDLMVEACINAKKSLKIAGKGSYLEDLKSLVEKLGGQEYIEFLGYVDDEQKADLLFNCKSLIFPVKDEDFGIVPIEANAAGCPVLAFAGGGVLETILDGETGKLFKEFSPSCLEAELSKWDEYTFDIKKCKENAERFSFKVFESKMFFLTNEILEKNN
jgi:glycosyltransferase involved in cell wall biosynthesis